MVFGHSSGGLLAAWITANAPKDVLGVVLEDPPFFKVQPKEMKNSFVWLDGFEIAHKFINQNDIKDYVVYYMESSYFWSLFGNLKTTVAASAKDYRAKHPGEPYIMFSIRLALIGCLLT